MSLLKLMEKRWLAVLGLNSGTSADGVDMAVMSISRVGQSAVTKFLKGTSRTYPSDLRSGILRLADSQSTTLDEVIAMDNAIGDFFGKCARSLIKKLSESGVYVDAIASHGQTVRPILVPKSVNRIRGTLQLGSLEMISTVTGKIT